MSEQKETYYVAVNGDDRNTGTLTQPWKTINHAAEALRPGETVYIRSGTYFIDQQIKPTSSGADEAWITYASFPGEQAIIDASGIIPTLVKSRPVPYRREQGAFHIENLCYLKLKQLKIVNSHWASICILDSQYIDLINNTTDYSFSSGISIWDTTRKGVCHHHRVLGNTVKKATTWDMIPPGYTRGSEPPHEAISIAGANHFEVAYNHVFNCDKEGIDVKETSKHGKVHHNYVHHVDRQGLYADAWFGALEAVEFSENIVHDCRGTGIAISVEDIEIARDIQIHHNLIYNNLGTGVYFSCWGKDGPRTNISFHHNTIHHNGYGKPGPDHQYYYVTGGLYLFSANLNDIEVRDNIFSENRGFQIGYSDRYLKENREIDEIFQQKNIKISNNHGFENEIVKYPIRVGWPGYYADVYSYPCDLINKNQPTFLDPSSGNFYLPLNSTFLGTGAFPEAGKQDLWWKNNFPPKME